MCNPPEPCPWICQICDTTGTGESMLCSVCYKTTCAVHIRRLLLRNDVSGLYELTPVCVYCAATGAL